MENKSEFERDVERGLNSVPKKISSKYFYDDEGSRIFQEIMEMPEYYLTNSEFDILSNQAAQIVDALDFDEVYSVIELGAGDGMKTFQLLKYMIGQDHEVHYRPVDISEEAINLLQSDLSKRLPSLLIEPLIGDYFKVLEALPKRSKPALFLFLGSNIGNYELKEGGALVKQFGQYLQSGDKMLVGFDLVKHPRVIQAAYDDPHGITRRFNLNLLKRMNRELDMGFDLDKFEFFPHYNPINGEVRSYIVSLEEQEVNGFHFQANELIHTELSKKFAIEEIEEMAVKGGYKIIRHFHDERNYFVDSLWEKL